MPSWQPLGLEVRLVAEFGRLATAAALMGSAVAAFGPRALQASDALTANHCSRRRTVSCSKLPIRASLRNHVYRPIVTFIVYSSLCPRQQ